MPTSAAPPRPAVLHDHVLDNLRYIRETMEGAASFTAVPGWGQAVAGVTALLAAVLASRQRTQEAWLATWLVEAAVAAAVTGAALVLKARRKAVPLASGPGRKFLLAFTPPVAVAALLTAPLAGAGLHRLLPPLWLLLYGTGVVAAGAFSARVVPAMGFAFLGLGVAALLAPAGWGDAMMALGFGGLLIGFGVAIARRHGG